MAKCNRCSSPVKFYQMSPYCKKCGAHLMFASFEKQFEKDRRIAEMSMAYFRYNLARFKNAYIGNKARKLKIAAALIPLIALFVPLGKLQISTPLYTSSMKFDIFGAFVGPFVTDGMFAKLDALSAGPVFGNVVASLKPFILCYAVMAVSAAVILLLEVFSFMGNKKECVLTCIFSATGIISAVLTKVFSAGIVNACETTGSLASASDGFMFIIPVLLFIVPLIAAVNALKHPPVPSFREGDELRVEYRRKYKKGLVDLYDIPAPIYESEEDKKERMKLIKDAYNINEDVEEVTADE